MSLHPFKELQFRTFGKEPNNKSSRDWKVFSYGFCTTSYRTHTISKPSGGVRFIEAPCEDLKKFQRDLLEEAEDFDVSPHAYGLGEKDYVSNAKQHEGRKHILRIDLKEFYRSTTLKRVNKVMPDGPAKKWIIDNALYIFYVGHRDKDDSFHVYLATGSPLSPYVSNLIVRALDDDISEMATRHNVTYTRYLDDMVFSTDDISEEGKWGLFKEVCERIAKDGWRINYQKSKWLNPNQDAMVVTGVDVRNAPKITRRYITSEIKPLLNNLAKDICAASPMSASTGTFRFSNPGAEKYRLPVQWSGIRSVEGFLRRIPAAHAGQLNYIHQVSPLQYKKLVQHFVDRVKKQSQYHNVLDKESRVASWARDILNTRIPISEYPAGKATDQEVEKFALAIMTRYASILEETDLPEPIALLMAGIDVWSKETNSGSLGKTNPSPGQEYAAV